MISLKYLQICNIKKKVLLSVLSVVTFENGVKQIGEVLIMGNHTHPDKCS